MKIRSLTVPTSWTATTFGCATRAIAWASRSSGERPDASSGGAVEELQRDLAIELRDRRRSRPCPSRRPHPIEHDESTQDGAALEA